MKRLALVGTDTGVGKTTVAVGLIQSLKASGQSVAAFKPLETGLDKDHRLTSEGLPADWLRLSRATGQTSPALGVGFELPAAPLAAARDSRQPWSIEDLDAQLDQLGTDADWLIVEGAGGLQVPITKDKLWVDFLVRWQLPCLVIGRLGLGTINHTLLTIESLKFNNINVLGTILCSTTRPGPEADQTPDLIAQFGKTELIDVIPYGMTSSQDLAQRFSEVGLGQRLISRYKSD